MTKPLLLGALYFAVVFAVAFALGVLRVLVVAPLIGAFAAVMMEVPIVVGLSFVVARDLLRDRSFGWCDCAWMGGFAFALLMVAECVLAIAAFGQTAAGWALALITPVGLLGLSAQLVFGLMPLFVRLSSR